MRKLIVQTEMSLDAVEDNPALWGMIFEHHNDETNAAFNEQFAHPALQMPLARQRLAVHRQAPDKTAGCGIPHSVLVS